MTAPVPFNGYAIASGSVPNAAMAPIVANFSPSANNITGPSGPFKIGQMWINELAGDSFQLVGLSSSNGTVTASWNILGMVGGTAEVVGTPHQISATTSVSGVTTVGLTNGISLGSDQATIPPVGGILMPGKMSMGASTDSRPQLYIDATGAVYGIYLVGSLHSSDFAGNIEGLFCNNTFNPAGSPNLVNQIDSFPSFVAAAAQTFTNASAFYGSITTNANVGTITNTAVFYADSGSAPAGTVTNSYGGFLLHPTAGVNSCALYADDMCIGFLGQTPPVNGAFIAGQVAIGANGIATDTLFSLSTQLAVSLQTLGSKTGATPSGEQIDIAAESFSAPIANLSNSYQVLARANFQNALGISTTNIFGYFSRLEFDSFAGSATTAYNFYSDPGTEIGGGGSITVAYGGYFSQPAYGTSQIALFADAATIGSPGTVPPLNGLRVLGSIRNDALTASQMVATDASSNLVSVAFISTAPSNSDVITTAFGTSLTAGTPVQNLTGGDILVSICLSASSATAATIIVGVSASATPTTDTVVSSFTTATADQRIFSAYVPANYYLLVNTTGTITVTSITTMAMGI